MHRKADASLQRRGLRVELVAVEAHSSLQTQRVPGTQPGGADAQIYEAPPDTRRTVWREVDLEPVLARVARTRDDGRNALYFPFGEPEGFEGGEVRVGEVLQELFCLRALQRQERPVVRF